MHAHASSSSGARRTPRATPLTPRGRPSQPTGPPRPSTPAQTVRPIYSALPRWTPLSGLTYYAPAPPTKPPAPSNGPNPFAAMPAWQLLGFTPPAPGARAAAAAKSPPGVVRSKGVAASAPAPAPAPAAAIPAAAAATGRVAASKEKLPRKYVSSLYADAAHVATGADVWGPGVTARQRGEWMAGFGAAE
ncbi:hypothetical protein B5807_08746 [Epicoccum nigrum]|uniref:Uncharacterized protein n=1 Tax=Epicoccum nigrum TaxID=105696 RepID=A0A1Y2LT97_EPING|nr:hypothetical protein B5807_08746 [Epicoccum nigrum]